MSDKLEIKKKTYEVSQDLDDLSKQVIQEKHMDLNPAKIKYVKVYPNINKKTAGRCVRSSNLLKLFGDTDYVIEMSGELWDNLDDERRKILMWHELMHVLPVQNEKTGEWDFRLRDHDIQEFFVIVKQYGVDWINDIKTLFSSVYDIDNVDELSL